MEKKIQTITATITVTTITVTVTITTTLPTTLPTTLIIKIHMHNQSTKIHLLRPTCNKGLSNLKANNIPIRDNQNLFPNKMNVQSSNH
jgi:hypothetical protein